MKYECYLQSPYTTVVEIIPTTEIDKKLLNSMERDNDDHQYTLYHHYAKGVKKCDPKAILVRIDDFVAFPTRALCTFEIERSLGGY